MDLKKEPREIDTVLFLPMNPGRIISKKVQKVEDSFILRRPGGRVRVVERGGEGCSHRTFSVTRTKGSVWQ